MQLSKQLDCPLDGKCLVKSVVYKPIMIMTLKCISALQVALLKKDTGITHNLSSIVNMKKKNRTVKICMGIKYMLHWDIVKRSVALQAGGGQGDIVPPETFHREIFGHKWGKLRQGKKGKNGKC